MNRERLFCLAIAFFFPAVSLILYSCVKDPLFLGEDSARKAVAEALADTVRAVPSERILIGGRENAIRFAEAIAFERFGREKVEHEKPYEAYLIDGYWIVRGTIPKGSPGGAFEIIFNSGDGKVLRLVHYK